MAICVGRLFFPKNFSEKFFGKVEIFGANLKVAFLHFFVLNFIYFSALRQWCFGVFKENAGFRSENLKWERHVVD